MQRVGQADRGATAPADPFWAGPTAELLERLGTSATGLTQAEAEAALARRRLRRHHGHGTATRARLLLAQFSSPIVLILIVATVISMLVGDLTDGLIILAIILASGLLGFAQEDRANSVVAELLRSVQVRVPVLRDERERAVPVAEVVPGDIVLLRAGAVVPADCRLLAGENLLVDESTLTGESFPVEKDAAASVEPGAELVERRDSVFLGTHVVSGTGRAVAVRTGRDTQFGAVSSELEQRRVTTAFTRGTTRFGVLLIWIMVILTGFIFLVNTLFGRPLIESLLFALALAVGLSPQMLPAIVSVSLSAGARRMARQRVVIKRLDAIEDLGALTAICTDKTGTLTRGTVQLDRAADLDGHESEGVLRLASLNAGLQEGFPNPLDLAILARRRPDPAERALDEVPYDFARRRLSVAAEIDGIPTLITKGAFESVLDACASARVGGRDAPIDEVRTALMQRYAELSGRGVRVLGIAVRTLPAPLPVLTPADETGMVLVGLLGFDDPPRDDAGAAVAELARLGVSVRLITGDNRFAAAAVAASVGLPTEHVLTGRELAAMDDAALASAVRSTAVFAEVEPLQKRRVVGALRADGETVGFLGDGINDAPALHAADVGISVDTAVDVAKQAAGVVLLDKSLDVIVDGVTLGRATFANTLKYVRVTTSANFGNMLSMAAASLFLPFLPLLPRQILLLNFLSDIPATTIAADAVDPEAIEAPGRWDLRGIRNFMIVFGLLSTVFDLATFAVLLLVFQAGPTEFRSAWFIESTLTEVVVLLSLRTARPVLRSRPGAALVWASVAIAVTTVALPYVPFLAEPLGLAPVPGALVLVLLALTTLYLGANELLKRRFLAPHRARLPRRA
ncbi:magnesium-translocating P-type ATPase [Agromyces aurantiacus]|uniref:Magnesium-transporting ATPase, P-type 1 n=1 Tax=Agromyces aurantiacus TaxID=165814 RepID=A0ABV9RAE6_9MICO|nr:magnesium-translocating P-type ATPase [Agromyces aurantiacus]MBM7504869.1 Mg2+-importing ATPase [Agromyces aurantiacus]